MRAVMKEARAFERSVKTFRRFKDLAKSKETKYGDAELQEYYDEVQTLRRASL